MLFERQVLILHGSIGQFARFLVDVLTGFFWAFLTGNPLISNPGNVRPLGAGIVRWVFIG